MDTTPNPYPGEPEVEATLMTNAKGDYKSVISTKAQRLFVISLFARGYTIRRIRKLILKEYSRMPREDELMRLALNYSDDIDQAREDLAALALTRGLAVKEERLLRYTELAESWEDAAVDGVPIIVKVDDPLNPGTSIPIEIGRQLDPKAAKVYQDTLKAIKEEVEPLGLALIVPPSDPWGQLLTKLSQQAEASNQGQPTSEQSTSPQSQLMKQVDTSKSDHPPKK